MIAKLDGRGEVLVSWEVGPGNLDHVRRLASGETHHFEYDEKGRPLSATADGVQLTFAHDETGRRTTDLRGGIGVRNEFDGPHLTATHYLDKFTVTYRWGSDGSLEVTDPTGGKHFFSFSPFGLVVCRLHSGSHELCQYDVNGLCLQKVRFHNSHRFTTWAREYLYSAEGDLVQVNDSQRGTTLYELDDAHRLIREKVPDTVARGIFRDAADNLLVQPGLSSVRMQDGNRLAEANGDRFSYNERNSIAKRSGKAGEIIYGYDSLDMLVRCDVNDQTWRAEYDPLRRRISKTWKDRKTEYYWDDSRLAAEINQDGSARLYLYVHPKALVPFMFVEYASHDDEPESGACYYIATNQIGVPVRVEDQQGREVWDARIDPFGQAHVDPRSSISMPLRFPGHYCDDEINLHCNGFRYYSPELARYLQSDPLGIAGGVNLYAYCVNPLTKVDIDGLADHPKGRQNADPKGESARIDHDADPRAPMRDLADAARDNAPNADARPNTVARLENADGSVRTGQSGTGSAPHSAVQEALDDVPPNQRSPHHGECAEIDAMSQNAGAAEQAGLDPTRANEGALIQTAEVRGAGGDQARHGAPQTPCSSCQHVMNRLGAGYNPR
jgi:RHS repeat-associated protein